MREHMVVKSDMNDDTHFSVIYGNSARIDVFRDWDIEKQNFAEAAYLFDRINLADSPVATAKILHGIDDGVAVYIPVFERFNDHRQKFEYSPLMFRLMREAEKNLISDFDVSDYVLKIIKQETDLRGNIKRMALVDIVELPKSEDAFSTNLAPIYYLNMKLGENFPLLSPDVREELVESVLNSLYGKKNQPSHAPLTNENNRMLEQSKREMRDWLRAGNRW